MPLGPLLFIDNGPKRVLLVLVGRDHQKPGRFIKNQAILVFVKDRDLDLRGLVIWACLHPNAHAANPLDN